MQQLKNIFRGASASQSRAPIVVSSTHYVLKTDVKRTPSGHDVVVVARGIARSEARRGRLGQGMFGGEAWLPRKAQMGARHGRQG